MEAITIPHVRIPSINVGGICLPGIGTPGSVGKKGLVWPAGMKEHIKAIYDPKKQGMTNFDVIEAYTEDFKKWNNSPEKYTGSLTSNSLAFTNVLQTTALIYYSTKPYDFKVLITGLQEGQHIKFGFDYGETILEADKNGVYTIEWKEGLRSYGIYTNFVGDCNITITQLPTSILKDLSGNGNHAYLYGGKGKLNSGMGLYKVDFTSYRKSSVQTEVKPDVVKVTPNATDYLFIQYANSAEIPSYKIKVIGLGDNVLTYQYATENGRKEINIVEGENELPTSIKVSNDYQIGYRLTPGTSVFTITQIPDYPDQLCYDGKMYAVCYGFPILTDYTVMAERTWFDNMNRACFLSKTIEVGVGAFLFEIFGSNNTFDTYSYGNINNVKPFETGITYQTKKSYNGNSILSGNFNDSDVLTIGKIRPTEYNGYVGCHSKIIIADRSFTEEEINWLKQNWDKI